MDVLADLVGWGIMGLTVAVPLMSVLTDLEQRVGGKMSAAQTRVTPGAVPGTLGKPGEACGREPALVRTDATVAGTSAAPRGPTKPAGAPSSSCRRTRMRTGSDGSSSSGSSRCCSRSRRHSGSRSGGAARGSEGTQQPGESGCGAAAGRRQRPAVTATEEAEAAARARLPPRVAPGSGSGGGACLGRAGRAGTGSAPLIAKLGEATPPPLPKHGRGMRPPAARPKAWNSSTRRVLRGKDTDSAGGAVVASYTITESQGPHPHWEDRHFITAHGDQVIIAVLDGHGSRGWGSTAAAFCAKRLEAEVVKRCGGLTAASSTVTGRTAVSGAFCKAFQTVDNAFRDKGGQAAWHAGTTALVVSVGPAGVWIANAGDCRAVLCRAGRALDLSMDHKPALASERARIVAAGGRLVRPDPRGPIRVCSPDFTTGLAVSRGLGDQAFKDPSVCHAGPLLDCRPDVGFVPVTRGEGGDEFIILASDGLWDVVTSQEAVDLVRGCLRSSDVDTLPSDVLATEAEAGGSQDNVTVLVVRL